VNLSYTTIMDVALPRVSGRDAHQLPTLRGSGPVR
jgi:hypothetical protein